MKGHRNDAPARPRKNGKKKDLVATESRRIRVVMDNLSSAQTIIERKLVTVALLATNASGFIPATQITSDSSRSASDFTSFSNRYSQFRVKAIRVRLYPLVDVNISVSAASGAITPHPTALAFARYMEGVGYINYASVVTGQSARVFNGRERVIEYEIDWANIPEARLWTASAAAVPTNQQYGIQFQDTGSAPASSPSTTYYRAVYEFVCQFTTPI